MVEREDLPGESVQGPASEDPVDGGTASQGSTLGKYLAEVQGGDSDAIFSSFLDAVTEQGFSLYPAQEQAILEVMDGKHVVLATPTGSGKSLVAYAMAFKAMAEGKRLFYTCPVKALVSEKFFVLCRELGAQNVGMLTGDASLNRDAPVVCCTAEILAKMALYEGAEANIHYVVMDEFHYYGDRDRGVAWQIPLLVMPQTTFLLMSATLGDTTTISERLTDLTHRACATVTSVERPVPLDFVYCETPIHETIQDLLRSNKAPVYLVNFTQRDSAEQAQNLLSVDFLPREEKARIGQAIMGFRFDTPFGKDIQRLVKHGLGIHHAGLLPKYRLLVEQLAQQGLLKIISGTDTLGVGVNIPIRTVLFTKLYKFDGEKTGILSVREFKQISGRAGRKGFDERGSVACQAPAHVIENRRQAMRMEAAGGKKKRPVKKKPTEKGFVHWDEQIFKKLVASLSEPLASRFEVSHGMLLHLLQGNAERCGGGYRALVELINRCHDSEKVKARHRRRAALLFRSLRHAGIVSVVYNRVQGSRVVINTDLQRDFSLNHTLSLYLLAALPQLDPQQETYGLDVLTLVEAILENPRPVLYSQLDRAKGQLIAELKAAGVEYEQRMEELEKVEYPKPLREFIYEIFNTFADKHPWVGQENIRPKSVAREVFERCMTFHEYVRDYGLKRSEGILLRYLSDAYKTLVQSVPDTYKDERVHEVEIYLRSMLERVDNSLVKEWEEMLEPATQEADPALPSRRRVAFDPRRDKRSFATRVRTEMHQLLKALSERNYELAAEIVRQSEEDPWPPERFAAAMAPYWEAYERLVLNHQARLPQHTHLRELTRESWQVQQVILDPQEEGLWAIVGRIDVDESFAPDEPLIRIEGIGT